MNSASRKWIARLTAAAAILLTALVLAAPADAAKILHRGNGAEPKSLDPHHVSGDPENQILGDLFMGLYTEDAGGHAILGAAESATTSPDGKIWTFKIRDHKWSDGTPVTANDFVYAYRRILTPETAAEYANILYPIKNAEKVNKGELPIEQLGVRAVDAKTLVIELENPAPYLPEMLTHYTTFPLPQHVVDKFKDDWTKAGNMVSNGPYMLAERRPNDHIKLVKNPYFYDAANVKIDEVYFYPTVDGLAALKQYRAGELDTQDRWPLTEYKWLQTNFPNETRKYTGLRIFYTVFNMRSAPLNDRRVRLALAMAVDREAIQRDIFFNAEGVEASSVLPPGIVNVDTSARVPWWGQSMSKRRAQARQLLQQAGFGPGHPLKVTYNFINSPDEKRQSIALQAMWKQIGVDVDIVGKEFAVHYDLLKTANFQIAASGWIYDYNDAQSLLFLFKSSTDQLNYPGYKNPAFDDLMHQAEIEPDGTKRGQLLGQATGLLINDVAVAPMFYPFIRPLVKSYVLNWQENPRGVNRTRWLDIADKPGPQQNTAGVNGGAEASTGGFWSWLGSWFSPGAWQKWWSS